MLGSVIALDDGTLDDGKDIAGLELRVALTMLATLPFPAVELHPLSNNTPAAKQTNFDGWLKDLVGMSVTVTVPALVRLQFTKLARA